ncbi:MAG TPA: SRPBCC domain-containing protein [Gemmatimonadaceae bacterium]|nr:SRPBCC domain-containing protein [Gemmatimonadaceae bacterium]
MKRSTVHHTFVIERTFAVPASRVYQAFADPKAKARWFVGPDEWQKSDLRMDERLISVSVATLELKPAGKGTKLTITEQGAYLDGFDNGAQRQHGTGELLDQLERALNEKVPV